MTTATATSTDPNSILSQSMDNEQTENNSHNDRRKSNRKNRGPQSQITSSSRLGRKRMTLGLE